MEAYTQMIRPTDRALKRLMVHKENQTHRNLKNREVKWQMFPMQRHRFNPPGQKTRIPPLAKKKQGASQSLKETWKLWVCAGIKGKKCGRVRAEDEFGLGPHSTLRRWSERWSEAEAVGSRWACDSLTSGWDCLTWSMGGCRYVGGWGETGVGCRRTSQGITVGRGEGGLRRKLPKAALPKSEIQMHVKLQKSLSPTLK